MPTYVSPTGLVTNDGGSELNPKPSSWLKDHHPLPGSEILLQAGAVYLGGIDWAWKGIGDPDEPITLGRYGDKQLPNPLIISHQDQPGITYGGPGGVRVKSIRFIGNCSLPNVAGLLFGPSDDTLANLLIEDVEVSGYTEAGVMVSCGAPGQCRDIVLRNAVVKRCGKGTYLWGIRNLTVEKSTFQDSNWSLAQQPPGNAGCGLAVYASQNVNVAHSKAMRNGLGEWGGGPAGFFIQDCDKVKLSDCESSGNGDGSEGGDGQGFLLLGVHGGLIEYCRSWGNLHGGFSLFCDPASGDREVRDCAIRHCRSVGDVVALAINGRVLGCSITHSHFETDATLDYRKCLDVSGDGPRDVEIWSNKFVHTGDSAPIVEADPGLAGIKGLEYNDWLAEFHNYRVRKRNYDKIERALAAESSRS